MDYLQFKNCGFGVGAELRRGGAAILGGGTCKQFFFETPDGVTP